MMPDRPRPEPALACRAARRRWRSARVFSRSSSSVRQSRISAPARRAPRPSLRELGRRVARRSLAHVGGACSPPSSGVVARTIVRSIWRARLAWISWPATARRSACATVPVRIGRSPRSCRTLSPRSGSSAKRRRNSEWSSSSPSANRTWSMPASLSAATTIVPSGRCSAWTRSSRSSTRTVAR